MTDSLKRGIDYIGVGVGACILNETGEVLLAQRGPLAKNERGTWEIPGGGVEFGETLEAALKREIFEEIGVEIEIISLLQVCDHILPAEKQHWVSPTFICKIISGEPTIKEPGKCSDMGWFSLEAAAKLPLSQITRSDIAMLQTRALQ